MNKDQRRKPLPIAYGTYNLSTRSQSKKEIISANQIKPSGSAAADPSSAKGAGP